LGTIISNVILLHTFKNDETIKLNTEFQILRFIEDNFYQSIIRTYLTEYVNNISEEKVLKLYLDLPFYQRFIQKGFQKNLNDLKKFYTEFENYLINDCYYPWNRTFECAFTLKNIN
jgi:hypothetical protein